MANRLFIYVPFDESTNSDIKRGADELAQLLNRVGTSIATNSDHTIVRAELMFLGEEARAADIDQDDVLLVHGHGGDRDTSISDNSGGQISLRTLVRNLSGMAGAGAFYFAICFSARNRHVATVWSQTNDNVYGYDEALQGALISATRSGRVINCMLTDGRLFAV